MVVRATVVAIWALGLAACAPASEFDPTEGEAYRLDADYRREVLERDLVATDNTYAQRRLAQYARPDGWDALSTRDPESTALFVDEAARVRDGIGLTFDAAAATTLDPLELPESDEEWIELGRRTWFEYPFVVSPSLMATARAGMLEAVGLRTWDSEFVGVRVFSEDGEAVLGPTCALCHASVESEGPSAVRSNRALRLGDIRLLGHQAQATEALDELETSTIAQLELLAAGMSDPLDDGRFTPYAFPDLGGIADMPYLHHTANWINRSTTTLAIRVETVYITGSGGRTRIPRALSWAVAMYLRSLPPVPPSDPVDDREQLPGREVFEQAGCAGCHTPPLFTSDRLVSIEQIGTDPAAGTSPSRRTDVVRIPSLRGVGSRAPYLHHGAVQSLEALFDPSRAEPGHAYGLALSDADRSALLTFLRAL